MPTSIAQPQSQDAVGAAGPAQPPTRRRGRPPGARTKTLITEARLGPHHFQFLRGLADGIDPAGLWNRYMSFTGDAWDARGGHWRTARLVDQVRAIAIARGAAGLAATALHPAGLALPDPIRPPGLSSGPGPSASTAPAPPSPALPSLDDWIEQQIAEGEARGEDLRDFYNQQEWLAQYREHFALDQTPQGPRPATALAEPPPTPPADEAPASSRALNRPSPAVQVAALRKLEQLVAQPVRADQPVTDWFTANIARSLNAVGVLSVGDLLAYIGAHGYRWNAKVRGVGATLASRITTWADDTADLLRTPLPSRALVPASLATLSDSRALAASPRGRFDIVPLDRLHVPAAWDGHDGVFRKTGPNTLGASNDHQAILAWLAGYKNSPRTFVAYGLAVERFYLWALFERRKALSSLTAQDIHAYNLFLAKPPAHWVVSGHAARSSPAWRPLRGPLTPVSRNHALTVISAMFNALRDHHYLDANPVTGVKAQLRLPGSKLNIRRSFTEQQWHCVIRTLDRRADTPQNRRLRLVLELGATTGLRRSELTSARYKDLTPSTNAAGERIWLLNLTGKGGKPRTVMIFDDIKAMIDAHHEDMAALSMGHDARVGTLRSLDPNVGPAPAGFDGGLMPLVGSLKKAPPRWTLAPDGVSTVLAVEAPRQADAYAALDPGALYQALKRLLREAAAQAEDDGALSPEECEALRRSSTHWIRHFFANNAVADGGKVEVLRDAMGHADISTTSVYLQSEVKAVVELISATRRRR